MVFDTGVDREGGGLRRLTFDMRGAQKAQPFEHPLDGRVRRLWRGHTECLQAGQERKLFHHFKPYLPFSAYASRVARCALSRSAAPGSLRFTSRLAR